jgi:hypothetical protein
MCVVVDKRERKLPGLLVTGNCTSGESWNSHQKLRRRLLRLKVIDPAVYAALMRKYHGVLDEIKLVLEKKN